MWCHWKIIIRTNRNRQDCMATLHHLFLAFLPVKFNNNHFEKKGYENTNMHAYTNLWTHRQKGEPWQPKGLLWPLWQKDFPIRNELFKAPVIKSSCLTEFELLWWDALSGAEKATGSDLAVSEFCHVSAGRCFSRSHCGFTWYW